MPRDTYTANVRIEDLPREADNIISTLASLQGKFKWQIVRDALVEYAERHRHEIESLVRRAGS